MDKNKGDITKGDITIDHIVDVYNHGMKAYKQAQQLFVKIDHKIHIEFAYATRSLVSLLDSKEKTNEYDSIAFNDAFQAARHILNDAVDLVVSYAALEIKSLENVAKYSGISDVYKDFPKISPILKRFQLLIAETRETRGKQRIDTYIEMVTSEDYAVLCDFCLSIEDIGRALKRKKQEETTKAKQWLATFVVATLILLFGNNIFKPLSESIANIKGANIKDANANGKTLPASTISP